MLQDALEGFSNGIPVWISTYESINPMEIFTIREGEILFKKYSVVEELGEFAVSIVESIAQTFGGTGLCNQL